MPKTKKLDDSSSDSDSSGPNDRNPPKKAKSDSTSSPPPKAKSSSSKFKEEENVWTLDKKRSVRLNEFKGNVYIDIREFYEDKSGDLKPGKKGISLSRTQWQKFKEVIPEIDEALKNH